MQLKLFFGRGLSQLFSLSLRVYILHLVHFQNLKSFGTNRSYTYTVARHKT